jgi:L-ascorbate metabolism protein UlaG (beta-lactamase superfamily)
MASAILIVLFLLVSCPTGNQHDGIPPKNNAVTITYTGNMGVLISNEKTAVWIDGLHEFYGPEYLNPPDSLLEKVFSKTPPFNKLKWLLFTHYHRDHFSKKLVNQFLSLGADRKVVGAAQVVDSFPTKHIIDAWNKNSELIRDDEAGLQIKAFNIPHTWPKRHHKVQNITYLVEIAGIRILHVGDADTDATAFDRIGISSVDVAIVPQWFDSEKGRPIIEKLKPKKVIVTHIAPGERTGDNNALKKQEPILFEKIGQSVSVK